MAGGAKESGRLEAAPPPPPAWAAWGIHLGRWGRARGRALASLTRAGRRDGRGMLALDPEQDGSCQDRAHVSPGPFGTE